MTPALNLMYPPYMRANLLIRPGKIQFKDIRTPAPSKGELLVKIKAALTCGTDLKAFRRGHPLMHMPTVFGHEFSGIVEKAGKGVKGFPVGTEVMAVHSAPCKSCAYCKKGLFNLCSNIMSTKVLGAFAEYILLPENIVKQNLFIKPKKLSFAEAAFLEPLSCVVHSINSAPLFRGDTAIIIGAGPVGLLHLLVLKTMGIRIIVMEKIESRLKKAANEGADMVLNPLRKSDKGRILSFKKHKGADAVFECTGFPEIWEDSVWLVRRGGTIILFGGCATGTLVTYDAGRIHYDEITLKGVFHYTPKEVVRAYNLLIKRKIKVSGLISGKYQLKDLEKAFKKLDAGEGIKYAITP